MNDQTTKKHASLPNSEQLTLAPRRYKFFNILVNGRLRVFGEKKITYSQVLELANHAARAKGNATFIVRYLRGDAKKPEGILAQGDVALVKPGMIFLVEPLA